MSLTLTNIRDFSETERQEISQYIQNNVPFTVLQRMFPLTENPIEKAEVFIMCYRLINTSKNLVTDVKTKERLESLLNSVKEVYNKLYNLFIKEGSASNVYKHKVHRHIKVIISNNENNKKINNLIDIFLILAEKFELLDMNKTTAIDLESEEGQQAEKDILGDEVL